MAACNTRTGFEVSLPCRTATIRCCRRMLLSTSIAKIYNLFDFGWKVYTFLITAAHGNIG